MLRSCGHRWRPDIDRSWGDDCRAGAATLNPGTFGFGVTLAGAGIAISQVSEMIGDDNVGELCNDLSQVICQGVSYVSDTISDISNASTDLNELEVAFRFPDYMVLRTILSVLAIRRSILIHLIQRRL